jgi:hypothetical protein
MNRRERESYLAEQEAENKAAASSRSEKVDTAKSQRGISNSPQILG